MPTSRRSPAAHRAPLKAVGSAKNQSPSEAQATDRRGIAQLIHCLAAAGYKVTGKAPRWMVQCPLHEDAEPSLGIDVRRKDGLRASAFINCRQCGAIGKQLCEMFGLVWGDVLYHPANQLLLEKPPTRAAPLPSPAAVAQWCDDLVGKHLEYLTDDRCINVRTLRTYQIGWDTRRSCYTLPVFQGDELVNLRRYYENRRPKMRGLAGRSIHLYPDVPESSWLLLCEGEWDALVGRAHGVPTVTSTGGACGWKAGWDDHFLNRDVAVVYDSDAAGRREAAKRAELLAPLARRVKVVDLAPDRDDGYDLSDWLTSGRTANKLRQLIHMAAPLGRQGRGGL